MMLSIRPCHIKEAREKAGMPDICLPVPHGGYAALYIELKTPEIKALGVQAEYALYFVANPDPRSIAAIEAKRKWLRGEITDAAAWDAAWAAARAAAWEHELEILRELLEEGDKQ